MNLTEEKKNEIKDFLWGRLDNTYISYFEWVGEDGDDNEIAYHNLNEAKDDMKAVDVLYGCTKSVFFFDELKDYVVKIPFMGEAIDCYVDEDNLEYDEGEFIDTEYEEYEQGGYNRHWDYCEVEADLYQEAIAAGVEDLLCGTWYLGEYHGYPIYISEKASQAYNYRSSRYYDFKNEGRSTALAKSIIEHGYGYFDCDIISMMIDVQGIRKVNQLMHFIKNFDISDFHAGNFMYDKNGNIRLVDYSSFHW